MQEDQKNLIDRAKGAAGGTVNQVTQSSVMTSTRERASAVTQKARSVAFEGLHLVSREDLARLEASLERIETALAELSERVSEKPAAKPRTSRTRDSDPS